MCVVTGGEVVEPYKGRLSLILGVVVIVLQVIAIGLCIGAAILAGTSVSTGFLGILVAALPIIVLGVFAILSGKYKTRCCIICHLVVAIVAAVFSFVFLAGVVGHLIVSALDLGDTGNTSQIIGAIVIDALLILIALALFILSIVCAVLCCQHCKALCCVKKVPHENAIDFESAIVSDKLIE